MAQVHESSLPHTWRNRSNASSSCPGGPAIDFHYSAATRAPRAWDREPKAPAAPTRHGRKVWRRYGFREPSTGKASGAAEGEKADADSAPRVVKRRCVGQAPLAQAMAQAAKPAWYLATLSERALSTPRSRFCAVKGWRAGADEIVGVGKISRRKSLRRSLAVGKEDGEEDGVVWVPLGGEVASQDQESVTSAEILEIVQPDIEGVMPRVRPTSKGSGLMRSPTTMNAVESGTVPPVNGTGNEDNTLQLMALSSTTYGHMAHSQEASSPNRHGETSAALTSREAINNIMINPSDIISPRPTITNIDPVEECTIFPHSTPVKEIPGNEHNGSQRRSQRLTIQTRENRLNPDSAPVPLTQHARALVLASTPNKEYGNLHECGTAKVRQEKALLDNAAVDQQALQFSAQSLEANTTAFLVREHELHEQTQITKQTGGQDSFDEEDHKEKTEPLGYARDQLLSPSVGDDLSKRVNAEGDSEGNLEGNWEGNLEGNKEGSMEATMEATTEEAAPARPEDIDGGEALVDVGEKNFAGRTRSGTRFSDDTSMLKDFLFRAQARKAARTTAVAPETITTPRRSPRKILGQLDSNSPSPTKSADVASHPGSPPGKSIAGLLGCDASDELCSEPVSYRRSGRTCPATEAPPGAPSFIPVRRADGTDPVVLQKSVAQELAIITRANTRRNKGSSKLPKVVLASLAGKVVEDLPAKNGGSKALKSVEWDERLVYFHETACSAEGKANKAKTRAKKRRSRGLGSGKGTPAPRIVTSNIAAAGTPAPRPRGKTKAYL